MQVLKQYVQQMAEFAQTVGIFYIPIKPYINKWDRIRNEKVYFNNIITVFIYNGNGRLLQL